MYLSLSRYTAQSSGNALLPVFHRPVSLSVFFPFFLFFFLSFF